MADIRILSTMVVGVLNKRRRKKRREIGAKKRNSLQKYIGERCFQAVNDNRKPMDGQPMWVRTQTSAANTYSITSHMTGYKLPLGKCLGHFTNELDDPDNYITEFTAAAGFEISGCRVLPDNQVHQQGNQFVQSGCTSDTPIC